MRFNATEVAILILCALWANTCGDCGEAYWQAHGRAYEACVEAHEPDECGGVL